MRALLPFLLLCAFAIRASEPDPIDGHIRAVIGINAKTNGICEVHHVQMEHRMVPVAFGMPPPPSPEYEQAQRDFPNSSLYVDGGCITSEKFLHARFPWYVCPECRRAERDWAEKHRGAREAKAILSGKDARRPDVSG